MTSTTSQHSAVLRESSSPNHLRIVRMGAMLLLPTRPFQRTFQRIRYTRSALQTLLLPFPANPLLHIRATGPLLLAKQTPRLERRPRSGLSHLRVLMFSSRNMDCRVLLRRAQLLLNVRRISGHNHCSHHRNKLCFLSRVDMSHLQRVHSFQLHKMAGSNRLLSCLCPQKSS